MIVESQLRTGPHRLRRTGNSNQHVHGALFVDVAVSFCVFVMLSAEMI